MTFPLSLGIMYCLPVLAGKSLASPPSPTGTLSQKILDHRFTFTGQCHNASHSAQTDSNCTNSMKLSRITIAAGVHAAVVVAAAAVLAAVWSGYPCDLCCCGRCYCSLLGGRAHNRVSGPPQHPFERMRLQDCSKRALVIALLPVRSYFL